MTLAKLCTLDDDAAEERERIAGLCLGQVDFEPSGAATAISSLRFEQCRHPSSDPRNGSFKFCQETRVGSPPYCEKHMRLCRTPARPFRFD